MTNIASKFATCTVAYNEEKLIAGMLRGVDSVHNLVLISKPWRGEHVGFDDTGKIAETMGAEVIRKDFDCQQDERNFGMDYLESNGYDYVFIVDADEYYTKDDFQKMFEFVNKTEEMAYCNGCAHVYWKSWKWHYDHAGYTVCLKSSERFTSKRGVSCERESIPESITMHHFTYERSPEEMRLKAQTREYRKLDNEWLKQYWDNWRPGNSSWKEMKESRGIPNEILARYLKSKAGFYEKT